MYLLKCKRYLLHEKSIIKGNPLKRIGVLNAGTSQKHVMNIIGKKLTKKKLVVRTAPL